MADPFTAEELFYSRYNWCLNPILSVRELIHRFEQELDAFPLSRGWQREEIKINLYLFACAIACTADDYFNLRLLDFAPLCSSIPYLRPFLGTVERVLNSSALVLKIAMNWRVWRWRKRWNSCLEEVCGLLLGESELCVTTAAGLSVELPKYLLNWKMRLPEAFRRQDFTHYDVISLIDRFRTSSQTDRPITIIGLRTAGSYFAPLMAAYLKRSNFRDVSWFSMRPKNGVSAWEKSQLRRQRKRNARVLLVDDYPATGSTIRLALEILRSLKFEAKQIAVLAPTHAAQPNWVKLAGIDPATKVFSVYPSELFKAALLNPESVEQWCAGYFPSLVSPAFRILNNEHVDEINARLAEHSKDGHHVREKRVFEIEVTNCRDAPQRRKILLKSVGWGWLGYHAFIAGRRLDGFVPRVFGLRNGLLIMEWIDQPAEERDLKDRHMSDVLASYVAARAATLRLTGDFQFESHTYRWTGLDEIVTIFRAAYGPYLSRLKASSLRKELHRYVTAAPTLIDGRMNPEEWLHTTNRIYKSDWEHHNFGGAEPDLADPAYDLAAAIFEFRLTKQHEEQLLDKYIALTGDRKIRDRIIVYKIFYASMAMRHSADRLGAGKQPEQNHELYHRARNFLIYSTNEFCAGLINVTGRLRWSDSLFFIEVDGVFDQDLLGFPHATQNALQCLRLLWTTECSVVFNTGRGIHDVRNYCSVYGIQGGIAEFGSAFVDAVHQKEVPLIDKETAVQLANCREAIRALPGAFIDPGYEYSIRAYRFKGRANAGLSTEEIRGLLNKPCFSRLSYISTDASTYIVQKGTNKGTGLTFVRRYLNHREPIAAIGHSDQDVTMLESAEHAYALANCSPAVRALVKQGRCHIVRKLCQSGLLAAVEHRLKKDGRHSVECSRLSSNSNCPDNILSKVLRAADRRLPWAVLADLFS
jgi:hydroxymethylpyrimidine pyrophosphatase-like HAD family hydrolase